LIFLRRPVARLLSEERAAGLDLPANYDHFAESVAATRQSPFAIS
jgi:hypothetical protein